MPRRWPPARFGRVGISALAGGIQASKKKTMLRLGRRSDSPYPWGNTNPADITGSSGALTTEYNLRTTEIDLGSGESRQRIVTRVTNERAQVTESHYDALGRLTRVVEPTGDATDYAYSTLDDLI